MNSNQEKQVKPDLVVDYCTHKAAAFACRWWHYSKCMPTPPIVKIGAWEANAFIGAVLFSRGASANIGAPYGLDQTQIAELTRIALRGHIWPVSKIMMMAIKKLRLTSDLEMLVSYADPFEGHHGGIYQATNWIYVGQQTPTVEYVDKHGRRWHGRMVSASGYTTVYGQRRKVVTPKECKKVRRPGKHKYLMPLNKKMRKRILPLAKPYPKRIDDGGGE